MKSKYIYHKPGSGTISFYDRVCLTDRDNVRSSYTGAFYRAARPGEIATHYVKVRNGEGGYGFFRETMMSEQELVDSAIACLKNWQDSW